MNRNIFEDIQSPFASAPSPSLEAPPPYSTLPVAPSDVGISAWSGPGAAGVVGYNATGLKLSYMDFVPRLVRKRLIGKNEYETFSTLVQRANNWLEEHSDVQIVSCETVTWFGVSHKEIFSDSSLFRKVSVTTFMRGLRFWFLTKVIPSPSHGAHSPKVIKCQTFPVRPAESFTQLMSQVNERLTAVSCEGKILGVETLRMHTFEGNLSNEATFWKEDIRDTKHVTFAFRIYTLLSETQGHETIGYQDFVPSRTNRSKENRGFELYGDMMDRATRWVARQQGVRFTNLQTISIKIKKNIPSEERCTFTEHGQRVTNFLNVARVYFVIERGSGQAVSHDTRLTYRTFSPAQIGVATVNSSLQYEDVRSLLDRINHWLQITGAKLFSIETVPVRLPTNASQSLGSEATFVPNQDGGSQAGKFLFHIRIYLTGDYVEPPGAVSLLASY